MSTKQTSTISGGVRRIIFTNNTKLNNNHYIVGSNIGALNSSVRRALMHRASNDSNGQPCCMFSTETAEPIPPPPSVIMFIGFEPSETPPSTPGGYIASRHISDGPGGTPNNISQPALPPSSSPRDYVWTGGAALYQTNSSTADEEVTNTQAYEGVQSWYIKNVYSSSGQGSPFSPKPTPQANAVTEAAFNNIINGSTVETTFYFKTEQSSAPGDGSEINIYNGSYNGDDRTGYNIYIENNAATGVRIYTFGFDGGFPISDIATGLAYNTWHKIKVSVTTDTSNPLNDQFEYSVNDGPVNTTQSWVNKWRLANGFTPVYGMWLKFAGSGNTTGFYIDNITVEATNLGS
jgi:hypothetical protein